MRQPRPEQPRGLWGPVLQEDGMCKMPDVNEHLEERFKQLVENSRVGY